MTVLAFPSLIPAVAGFARPQERRPTYGLVDVARIAGCDGNSRGRAASPRSLISSVLNLMKHAAFPAPLPNRRGVGADAVFLHARWDRRAVQAWIDGLLPPPARAALDAATADAEGDLLDARADSLDELLERRRA